MWTTPTTKAEQPTTYNSWLKSVGKPAKDVKNITDAEVKEIYFKRYWMAAKCDSMSKKFAVACFDSAVNHGVGKVSDFLNAAKWNDINLFFIARIRYYNDFVKGHMIWLFKTDGLIIWESLFLIKEKNSLILYILLA